MSEIIWTDKLDVKVEGCWREASLLAQTPTEASVVYGKRQLLTVPLSDIRNTPCTKTAGTIFRSISKSAFQEQLGDEEIINKILDALEEEGLVTRQ